MEIFNHLCLHNETPIKSKISGAQWILVGEQSMCHRVAMSLVEPCQTSPCVSLHLAGPDP